MTIYPAIDLRGGKCVRLVQGDYDRQKDYHDDPVAVAKQFEQTGATWLHMVDLDAARTGKSHDLHVIEKVIAATNLKVQVGGGVRSDQVVAELLSAGASRAIIGTAALKNWPWFAELVNRPENHNRIALGLDARNGMLAVEGWTETTGQTAVELAGKINGWPVAAIVYTDIDRDGMLGGPNVAATAELAAATSVPVIASGGVGSIDHVRALVGHNIEGVIIGTAIYEQKVDLGQALALATE